MSDTVITVENLSKKYIIGHQRTQRYTALRDVITDNVKEAGRRVLRRSTASRPTREEIWALKDVSFEVKQGERLGIIGRNGAGKSTLLKILSRITEPSAGRVRLRGRVASLLEVGTGFHPELTGRENIYLNGAILGMSRAEIQRKFDEIVAFAEVEQFLDTPVKRYSSGMYVRLAFAVAAHLEPEILVVDEVLAVGDAAFQKKSIGQMEKISQGGRTVLFVSHNMATIQRLCGRGLLLERGQILEAGDIAQVISKYLTTSESDELARFNPNQRGGRGWARIRDVRLYDADRHQVSAVTNDADLILEFDVAVSETETLQTTLRGLLLEVMFYTEQGQPLMSSMSVDFNGVELPAARACRLKMRLPGPTFVPGRYRLNLFLGVPYLQHVDEIQSALQFEILPPAQPWRPFDLYPTWGHICRQCEWSLVETRALEPDKRV